MVFANARFATARRPSSWGMSPWSSQCHPDALAFLALAHVDGQRGLRQPSLIQRQNQLIQAGLVQALDARPEGAQNQSDPTDRKWQGDPKAMSAGGGLGGGCGR